MIELAKLVCKVVGHAEWIQGPECGSVCSRCEEYPEHDNPYGEAALFRKVFGLCDDDDMVCNSCLDRVNNKAVREGRAEYLKGSKSQ